MNQSRLSEKVIVVTGAGRGIGRSTAETLAEQGARVVVADLDNANASEVAGLICQRGGEAIGLQVDVSRADSVEQMVAATVERFGRLDGMFNNAGIAGNVLPIADDSEDNFDQVIAVNLKGVWLCTRAGIRQMLKQGGGAIVNCSSTMGLGGLSGGQGAYSASKHGVIGITKSAAIEYGKQGIRVNAVCPGGIVTPLFDEVMAGSPFTKEALDAVHPIGHCGEASDLAGAVGFLLSDDAAFITGAVLPVDGGVTAV